MSSQFERTVRFFRSIEKYCLKNETDLLQCLIEDIQILSQNFKSFDKNWKLYKCCTSESLKKSNLKPLINLQENFFKCYDEKLLKCCNSLNVLTQQIENYLQVLNQTQNFGGNEKRNKEIADRIHPNKKSFKNDTKSATFSEPFHFNQPNNKPKISNDSIMNKSNLNRPHIEKVQNELILSGNKSVLGPQILSIEKLQNQRQNAFPKKEKPKPLSAEEQYLKDEQVISDSGFIKLNLLGSAGFANVYHCQGDNNTNVAVKIYRESDLEEENRRYVEAEQKFLSCKEFQHPNIIKLIKYVEKHKVLVLEYVPYDLRTFFFKREKIHKDLLKNKEIVTLVISQILTAIKWLHDHNFCHRDIKMENVLIDPITLQIKLIDFNTLKYYPPDKQQFEEETMIRNGYKQEYFSPNNDGMYEKDVSRDEIFWREIYAFAIIVYCLFKQEDIDPNNFNFLYRVQQKNDNSPPLFDLMKSIFVKEITTIEGVMNHKDYKEALEAINPRPDFSSNDPFSPILRKKIGDIMQPQLRKVKRLDFSSDEEND